MVQGKATTITESETDRWTRWLIPVASLLAVSATVMLHPDILDVFTPDRLANSVARAGMWGPALYIALITVSVVVSQIPGAPLAIAAGAVWDPLLAGLYTVIGGFGGALIAYSLGRSLGPSILQSLTGKTLSFSTERGERYLGWMIFTTRLLPVFSFDLISYGAGITGLSFPIYASATFFGMVPSTLLLTYLGGSFHISSQIAILLAGLFAIAFIGIPALLHRFNWLNVRDMVNWE